jgi:hypothetical protein
MAEENIIVRLALQARDYVSGAAKASKATRGLAREAAAVEKKGNKAAKALDGMAKKFVALFAARKAAQFLKDSVRAFSDLTESANAVEVQFAEGADIIKDFGETAATAVGLAQSEFQQLSIATGALVSNFISDNRAAARETVAFTQRAADVASVFNVDVTVALAAFQSAVQGQSRPIRQFGVLLDDFSVRQKAVALGLAETTGEVTQQEKAQARLALIYEQTEKTVGDFAATSDDLANKTRIVGKELEDAKAKIGEALEPAMQDLLDLVRDGLIPVMIDLVPIIEAVTAALGFTVTATEPLFALIGRAVRDLGALTAAFMSEDRAVLAVNSALNNIVVTQRKGGSGAVAFANGISTLTDLLILDKEALDLLSKATTFHGDQEAVALQLALDDARARGVVAGQLAILEDALLSQVDAMNMDALARSELIETLGLSDAAIRANTVSNAEAQAATVAASVAIVEEKRAMKELREAADTVEGKLAAAAAANDRAAAAAEGARGRFIAEADAIREVARAQAEAANPLLRLLGAQGRVRDAQQAIVDVQEDDEASTQDLTDAKVDLLKAQLDLEGATADAADKIQDGETALFELAAQAGVSEDFVRDLIDALDDLPTLTSLNIHTRFTESGREQRGFGHFTRPGDVPLPGQFGSEFGALEPIRVGEGGPETLIPLLPGRIDTGPAGNTGGETNITLVMEATGDAFDDVQLGLAMLGIAETIEVGGDSTLRG